MVLCCSRQTFLSSVVAWLVISLGCLSFALYAMLGGDGVYLVPPETAYVAIVGLFSLWVIVSCAGTFARLGHAEWALVFFIIMCFFTILITIFGSVYILLYANDIETFAGLDSTAGEAQQNAEKTFFAWANQEVNKAAWKKTQNDFQCCGYDLQSYFGNNKLETGDLCNGVTFNVTFCPGKNVTAECEAAALKDANVGENFFCKDALSQFFKDQTPIIASVFGVLVLIQLVSWVSAMRMYWVPFSQGGFMGDDGYDGGLPTKASPSGSSSGMDLSAPAPNNFGPGNQQTSAFGRKVQNFGNRVSARISTRMPFGGGGGAGGFGGAAGGNGFGGGNSFGAQGSSNFSSDVPGPNSFGGNNGGQQPGGFSGFGGAVRSAAQRVSMKFGFGGARPPPGPPPSFGGSNGQMSPFAGAPSSPSGGGFGSAPSRGGGFKAGGDDDIPAPNTFNAGNSAAAGGGFGAAVKGFGNRVSARMKPMFGFGRPPPGIGGGNSGGFGGNSGGSFGSSPSSPPSFGGAPRGPPPSFGGGAPRGAPSFGGGAPRGAPSFGGGAPRGAPSFGGGPSSPPPGRGGGGFGGGAPPARGGGGFGGGGAPPSRGGFGGGPSKGAAPRPAMGGGRGGLLAEINRGKALNRTVTNDRSAPQV